MFLALVGNILVIYILYKRPETRRLTSFMYVNLAVADLLVTVVVMPQNLQSIIMKGRWLDGVFGEIFAKLVLFTFYVAQMASVYSLTAIAFDSFFSIVFSLREFPRFRNKKILVPCIWLISMCFMSPWLIIPKVRKEGQLTTLDLKFSQFGKPVQSSLRGVYLYVVITIFALPFATMSFLYGYVCLKLKAHSSPGESIKHDKARRRANKTKRQVIRMSIAIVVAFALCWIPTHVYHVILTIDYEWSYRVLPSYVMFVCYWCGHANSAVNPWMLIYFKKRFRAVFRKMLSDPLSRMSLTSRAGTMNRPAPKPVVQLTQFYQFTTSL